MFKSDSIGIVSILALEAKRWVLLVETAER